MLSIMDVRNFTKTLLVPLPIMWLNDLANVIAGPSLSTIGDLTATTSHAAVLALWLHVTKGYALYAKTYGEL